MDLYLHLLTRTKRNQTVSSSHRIKAAKGFCAEPISTVPQTVERQLYREDFDLTRSEYAKAFLELTIGSNSVTDYFENDSAEIEEDEI